MSSGPFVNSFYGIGDGSVVGNIRIQPETETLTIGGTANASPGGPATTERGVSATGRRSTLFIGARRVNVRVTAAGTSNLTVGESLSIPWLNAGTFFGVVLPKSQTGTYQGASVEVIGSSPERL